MVGQWTGTKPSRSDEVLDANQQLQITNQIRAQFDSVAPKRPAKPNRSESESDATSPPTAADENSIPELGNLRSQSPVIFSAEGANMEQEEFVETQYYKELESIDKQHHTTGTGFISVAREENMIEYDVKLPSGRGAGIFLLGCKSNPATNDWTPGAEDDQAFVSSKPNRSENS